MSRPSEYMTPSTSAPPSFQEAFESAKEEHSKVADATDEHAPPDEASTDDDEESETPETATAAADTGDDKELAAPEKADKAKPPVDTGLLTAEEFTALQTTHAKDPAALLKALEGAFTKKTQTLAAERESVKRLQSYAPLIEAYESDPAAVVKLLAEENGLVLVPKGTEAAAAPAKADEAASGVDALLDEFRTELGPELEYLADGLAPAIKSLVQKLTATTVEEATKPLKAQQNTLLTKAAEEATETVMTTFGTKHPDWKDHEPAMLALAAKIEPKGMSEGEFLEHLYNVVTRDTWEKDRDTKIAEATKTALAKMRKGAATTDTHQPATPESQVRRAPSETPSFAEAYEAAKRGERWE